MVVCQGFASMMNHMPDDETRAATSKFVDVGRSNHNRHKKLSTLTHHKVKAGAELSVDYGKKVSSKYNTNLVPERTPEELREFGYCVDGIQLDSSDLPIAARPFSEGEILAVSPVAMLEAHEVAELERLGLVNHLLQDGTRGTYFPYGSGIGHLQSHQQYDGKANVATQWISPSLVAMVAQTNLANGQMLFLHTEDLTVFGDLTDTV